MIFFPKGIMIAFFLNISYRPLLKKKYLLVENKLKLEKNLFLLLIHFFYTFKKSPVFTLHVVFDILINSIPKIHGRDIK